MKRRQLNCKLDALDSRLARRRRDLRQGEESLHALFERHALALSAAGLLLGFAAGRVGWRRIYGAGLAGFRWGSTARGILGVLPLAFGAVHPGGQAGSTGRLAPAAVKSD